MSRRIRTEGVASLTLLEAPTSNSRDDFKYDLEGSGMDDDISKMKIPQSPTSPLTAAVVKNSMRRKESVAVVHRVKLRNFDENAKPGEKSKRLVRRYSTGSLIQSEGKSPARRATLEMTDNNYELIADIVADSSVFMSRKAGRPTSAKADFASSREGPPSAHAAHHAAESAPNVRSLSSQEIVKRNKDAVDWFRASRAINQNIRSIEDTEGLLEAARKRREAGTDHESRSKSKEIPLGGPLGGVLAKAKAKAGGGGPLGGLLSKQAQQEEAAASSGGGPKRRSIDPAALWAAKPKAAPKPDDRPIPQLANVAACMRGVVKVGDPGENGLLARLRRRKTIS